MGHLNLIYIGQSKNSLKTRFSSHLSCIRKFNRELPDNANEVAYHFNLAGHNVYKDLRIGILRKDIQNDEDRIRIEKDFINLFEVIHPPVINRLIPALYNMKNVLFTKDLY